MKYQNKRRNADWKKFAILALYMAGVILLLTRHENWRDEAQAWLLARDLDFVGLVRQMRYEGHPCLWHLLLMPLAKSGLPFWSMNILSFAITLAAAVLMLWKAPLALGWKAVCLFTATFLFYLPVVSRSYCLIALFVLMSAAFYARRREKPVRYGLSIALLVQTHFYMLPMAGMMSMVWLGEAIASFRRDKDVKTLLKQGAGLFLPLLSLLFLLVQVGGASESYGSSLSGLLKLAALVIMNLAAFVEVDSLLLSMLLAAFFIGALLVLTYLALRSRNWDGFKPLLILGVSMLGQAVISVVLFGMNTQKRSLIVVYLIWLIWCMGPALKGAGMKRCMAVALAAVCLSGLLRNNAVLQDWNMPYSDGEACAAAVAELVPEDALVLQSSDPAATTLLPHLESEGFYSIMSGEKVSFTTWGEQEQRITDYEALCTWAEEKAPGVEEVYLIAAALDAEHLDGLEEQLTEDRIIYETEMKPVKSDEVYRIYRIPVLKETAE